MRRLTLHALESGIPFGELAAPLAALGFGVSLVSKARRPARGRVNAELALERVPPPGQGVALGVLRSDLFLPGRRFVFGLAHLGGGKAVVSLARLGDSRKPLFRERWVKEALHEVGHALGLEHCESLLRNGRSCVMRFSPSLAFVDEKGGGFCASCARRLSSAGWVSTR